MARAPAGVGLPLSQPGHQHVASAGGLLGQAVGLADGGVQVDGQRSVAGTGPGSPGPGQKLPAHPVELADVAPAEAAQEGAQGGRGLDHAAQDTGGPATAQGVSVADAVAVGQGGGHQGNQFVASVGPARSAAQIQTPLSQLGKIETPGQGGGKHQPGVGHQAVTVEGDLDAVGVATW